MSDNCIKEYQNNDCYKVELKYQRGKLHVMYFIIISVILMVISFAIQLGSNSVLGGQLSFASTVSSIILSAIAIFMSISSERKTDSIRDQLVETASRLESTTAKVESINLGRENEIEESINHLNEIKSSLMPLIDIMSDVSKKTDITYMVVSDIRDEVVYTNKNTIETASSLSDKEFVEYYNKIISECPIKTEQGLILSIEYTFTISSNSDDMVYYDEVLMFINKHVENKIENNKMHFIWAFLLSFSYLGSKNNAEAKKLILEVIHNKKEDLKEAIVKNHDDYKLTHK